MRPAFGSKFFTILSLHDVSPAHLHRLERAEAFFQRLGVYYIQYFFVPEFHGRFRASEFPEFLAWCRKPRSFNVQWLLHGYYHLERNAGVETVPALNWKDRLKRRFLTDGEGEFLTLDAATQRKRLEAGLEEFRRCLPDQKLHGFVAPAWLFNDALMPLLREFEIPFTEDHHRLYNVALQDSIESPVVTWATRTSWHLRGSLLVNPLRARWFDDKRVLRLAMHPHDFDHPDVLWNIEKVYRKLYERRLLKFPKDLDWDRLLHPENWSDM